MPQHLNANHPDWSEHLIKLEQMTRQLSDLLNEEDYYDEIHAAFRRCGARWIIGYAADHFLRQHPPSC